MMATNFQKLFWKSGLCITFLRSSIRKIYLERKLFSTLEKVKMSKNIELWKMQSANQSLSLTLMFLWLKAPTPAVQKYANLYHQRGMDVLVVRGTLKHFLWPPYSSKLGYEIEKCLSEIPFYQKYLIHSFSVGAYNYTIAQMNTRSGVPSFPSEKVIGQIYDSVTIGRTENLAEGFAVAITNNRQLQQIIKRLTVIYIQRISKKTQDSFDKGLEFFKKKSLPVPSLFFYCENDPMCDLDTMKELLTFQREKHGDKIWEKSWPISAHASHLRFHEEDYVSVWSSFLSKLGI